MNLSSDIHYYSNVLILVLLRKSKISNLKPRLVLIPTPCGTYGHDHSFGQTSRYVILNCIVKYYRYYVMFYEIRNTQYAIRNTRYIVLAETMTKAETPSPMGVRGLRGVSSVRSQILGVTFSVWRN